MDDLTKCLYEFVCKQRMGSVYADPEYTEAARSVELQTEKVREGMSREQWRELNHLLDSMNAQSSIECEHLFRAALGLARELNRAAG